MPSKKIKSFEFESNVIWLLWLELHEIVSAECESHAVIDNTLRAYLSFTARYKGPDYFSPPLFYTWNMQQSYDMELHLRFSSIPTHWLECILLCKVRLLGTAFCWQHHHRPPGVYANSIDDISHCSYKLLSSSLFSKHADYVRRQIIYGLLQVCEKDGARWYS